MKTVDICIFEDVRFKSIWDIPRALKCDARRKREQRGWTFCLHDTFCPENESKNAGALAMDSVEAYSKAINYVSDELKGYGCLFFDCEFFSGDGENLELTREQAKEVSEFVSGKIKEFAFPGLFLALRAAKNPNWSGVIAIASNAAHETEYKKFAERLQAICKNKRVLSLERALTDFTNDDKMGETCEIAIEQFLQLVGARRSPKERLHPLGTESWFAYDGPNDSGCPPHEWKDFYLLGNDSHAWRSIRQYFANLLGCTDGDAGNWVEQMHQATIHGELKKSLGACALAHSASDDTRGPALFTVLLGIAACCPNPISWIKNVKVCWTANVFNSKCSAKEAQDLLYDLIADGGLFQTLFVWDQEKCPNRQANEPVIVKAEISSDSLRLVLHTDFEVAKLKAGKGGAKRSLDKVQQSLRNGKHPLSITLDENTNAVVFEVRQSV